MAATINCDDLEEAIDHYTNDLGYRLDMIVPADAPREALLSRDGAVVQLVSLQAMPKSVRKQGLNSDGESNALAYTRASASEWVTGRAGMEYRDLIPGRMDGKMIASHIRLTEGGEVPDYVHYHKVKFQMIYCLAGAIKVVYEDQGEPFWLRPGDCVLQPPEIRHRVLECTPGSEVIEIGMPAIHETWVEHEIELPTNEIKPDRDFSGQRFHRHIAAENERTESNDGAFLIRDLGLVMPSASGAAMNIRAASDGTKNRPEFRGYGGGFIEFFYIIEGELILNNYPYYPKPLKAGDGFIAPDMKAYQLHCSPNIEVLHVLLTD